MNLSMRACIRFASLAACSLLPFATSVAAPPFVGPNVNMVQGTKWPQGDPFLTNGVAVTVWVR